MKNNKLSDKERLAHILDYIAFIEKTTCNISNEEILSNFILTTALTKWMEIIGEACFKLSKEFKKQNEKIPWNEIEGLRHILVHDYYEIDTIQLCHIIKNELPQLKTQIEDLYNNFKVED